MNLLHNKCSSSHAAQQRRPPRAHLLVAAAIKAKSVRQVCCSKTLVAKPEHVDQVKHLCKEVTEFSLQQMANRGNGIQEFNCAVDGWEPNVIHFWERYESNVALGRHNTKPEVEQFMNKVVPLLEKPVGMALYEYRDGQLGAPSMQSGPKGEGGLDDATGASGAAGGASYKQTSNIAQLQSLKDDDVAPATISQQGSSSSAADSAWWSFAGSQPAAVAALVGAAAVLVVAGIRLAGH